jgi:6-phosphogluconolactonase (cycloisomerase 2 family)
MNFGPRGKPLAVAGSLTMLASVAVGAGTGPKPPFVPPDGKHAYVPLASSNLLAQYTVNADGTLTAFATRDITTTYVGPAYMCSSPDGTSLYLTAAGSYAFKSWQRNTTSGVLTSSGGAHYDTGADGSGTYAGQYPAGIICSPDGLFVYTACRFPTGMGTVAQHSRNTSSGVLSQLSPPKIDVGSNFQPMGIAMTQANNGAFVYVANFNNDSISLFTRNTSTGLLSVNSTQATKSTGSSTSTCWLAISPIDAFLYVVLDNTAQIAVYPIDSGTGALGTLVNKYATNNGPFSIQISSDGLFAYVGDSDGGLISQYSLNTSTGAMTLLVPGVVRSDPLYTTTSSSIGPTGIALCNGGKHLLVVGAIGTNSLTSFRIHP